MSYHYSATPHFRELFDCPSYMRFGTLNVRSMYISGSLKAVARELVSYGLALVRVQEGRWEKRGSEKAEDYTFFYLK